MVPISKISNTRHTKIIKVISPSSTNVMRKPPWNASSGLAAPRVFVTNNGDSFDWPFIQSRALQCGLDMGKETGMRSMGENIGSRETRGRTAVHMDAFQWVQHASHIPPGSRGLKAVTRELLRFEPEEIPPEEMMDAAIHRPHEMAKYSVSDAVCTYYLYMKYVHLSTFSLCNIIPLNPDDVLRGKGKSCLKITRSYGSVSAPDYDPLPDLCMVPLPRFPSEEYLANARDSILEMRVDGEKLRDIISKSICYNGMSSNQTSPERLHEIRSRLFAARQPYLFKPVRKLEDMDGKEKWLGTRITTAEMFQLGFRYRLVWRKFSRDGVVAHQVEADLTRYLMGDGNAAGCLNRIAGAGLVHKIESIWGCYLIWCEARVYEEHIQKGRLMESKGKIVRFQ